MTPEIQIGMLVRVISSKMTSGPHIGKDIGYTGHIGVVLRNLPRPGEVFWVVEGIEKSPIDDGIIGFKSNELMPIPPDELADDDNFIKWCNKLGRKELMT